jgi:hypothetical protein
LAQRAPWMASRPAQVPWMLPKPISRLIDHALFVEPALKVAVVVLVMECRHEQVPAGLAPQCGLCKEYLSTVRGGLPCDNNLRLHR